MDLRIPPLKIKIVLGYTASCYLPCRILNVTKSNPKEATGNKNKTFSKIGLKEKEEKKENYV